MSHAYLRLSNLKTLLLLMALSLIGCNSFTTGFGLAYHDPYGMVDFDELLGFGANMTNMTDTGRTNMCRSLLSRQQTNPAPGLTLHLMMGRLFSDACGDIGAIVNELTRVPRNALGDARMQQWIAINTETLERMDDLSKKTVLVRRRPKPCPSPVNSTSSRRPKTAQKAPEPSQQDEDEAQLLREKLEAIRSMEKQLDESSDGN